MSLIDFENEKLFATEKLNIYDDLKMLITLQYIHMYIHVIYKYVYHDRDFLPVCIRALLGCSTQRAQNWLRLSFE